MGLAPYGLPLPERYLELLDDMLQFDECSYSIDRNVLRSLASQKRPVGKIDGTSKILAALAQQACERIGLFLAKRMYETTGCGNFVLSGGVALNCETNRVLASQGFVEKIYVQPAANDGGSSLGAALYCYTKSGGQLSLNGQDSYLGPEYSNEDIARALRNCGIASTSHIDPAIVAADLLSKGRIIGWYQGRAEFGPRALGNRSILADPRKAEMKELVNQRVKHRENWRPFAPSVLCEYADEWFDNAFYAPHMTLSFKAKPHVREIVPAVIHVDGTARVQTVSREANPEYHRLIQEFHRLTGVPMVLNTSFNARGQPMVCTSEDAIGTFFSTGLDALIMGNHLIEKQMVTNRTGNEEPVAVLHIA